MKQCSSITASVTVDQSIENQVFLCRSKLQNSKHVEVDRQDFWVRRDPPVWWAWVLWVPKKWYVWWSWIIRTKFWFWLCCMARTFNLWGNLLYHTLIALLYSRLLALSLRKYHHWRTSLLCGVQWRYCHMTVGMALRDQVALWMPSSCLIGYWH